MKKSKGKFLLKGELFNKKGVSIVIGWVLLIGFAVTLAVIVYQWSVKHGEKLTSETVEFVSGKVECNEISLNVQPCFRSSYGGNQLNFTITNKGFFNLKQFVINVRTGTTVLNVRKEEEIKVKLWKTLKIDIEDISLSNIESIDIIPIIEVENKMVGCDDRKITFSENIMEEIPPCGEPA